jgi:NADH dehydrogenase FAD-containing subunit
MRKDIVILGGGVGGTIVANLVAKDLNRDQARVTLVHGLLALPHARPSRRRC